MKVVPLATFSRIHFRDIWTLFSILAKQCIVSPTLYYNTFTSQEDASGDEIKFYHNSKTCGKMTFYVVSLITMMKNAVRKHLPCDARFVLYHQMQNCAMDCGLTFYRHCSVALKTNISVVYFKSSCDL